MYRKQKYLEKTIKFQTRTNILCNCDPYNFTNMSDVINLLYENKSFFLC